MHDRLVAASVVLLTLVTACTATLPAGEHSTPSDDERLTLLQMNLCLSGIGTCLPSSEPADAMAEAISTVRQAAADLVVLNEACSKDAERVASATDLHLTFTVVRYRGAVLTCRDPDGRGLFGNAVLTAARPLQVRDRAYRVQDRIEERRLLCVRTKRLWVCGTHLNIPDSSVNHGQCAELGRALRSLPGTPPAVASGDMNRRDSCAPPRWWARTDRGTGQRPGLQHVYGDPRLTVVSTAVEPMTHTDHDALVVRFGVPETARAAGDVEVVPRLSMLWAGAGSNRRPSTFQADARTN